MATPKRRFPGKYAFTLLAIALASHAVALDVQVAPDGPIKSLQPARDEIRRLRREGHLHEPVHVQIADGILSVNRTRSLWRRGWRHCRCPSDLRVRWGSASDFHRWPANQFVQTRPRRNMDRDRSTDRWKTLAIRATLDQWPPRYTRSFAERVLLLRHRSRAADNCSRQRRS